MKEILDYIYQYQNEENWGIIAIMSFLAILLLIMIARNSTKKTISESAADAQRIGFGLVTTLSVQLGSNFLELNKFNINYSIFLYLLLLIMIYISFLEKEFNISFLKSSIFSKENKEKRKNSYKLKIRIILQMIKIFSLSFLSALTILLFIHHEKHGLVILILLLIDLLILFFANSKLIKLEEEKLEKEKLEK